MDGPSDMDSFGKSDRLEKQKYTSETLASAKEENKAFENGLRGSPRKRKKKRERNNERNKERKRHKERNKGRSRRTIRALIEMTDRFFGRRDSTQ